MRTITQTFTGRRIVILISMFTITLSMPIEISGIKKTDNDITSIFMISKVKGC